MFISPRYSVTASNLLRVVKSIALRHNITKKSAVQLSLYLLFTRCIIIEKENDWGGSVAASIGASQQSIAQLAELFDGLERPYIADKERLSLFIEFYGKLTGLLRKPDDYAIAESGQITGALLRELLAETRLPNSRARDDNETFTMILAAYDHLFYALHDSTSKHAERVYAGLLQGFSLVKAPLIREWPLISGEIVLSDANAGKEEVWLRPLLKASVADISATLQMRLALHQVEPVTGRKADLKFFRDGNITLHHNGPSVMATLAASGFNTSAMTLMLLKRLPKSSDFKALMASGKLQAVIEFTTQRKKYRLCLLSNRSLSRNVLMIDTTRLDQAQNLSAGVQTRLIGETFRACFDIDWRKPRGTRQEDEQSNGLLTRFFRRGYEDIAGYCQRVPREEITQVRQLQPGIWIKPPQASNTFNGLNMDPIYSQLIADGCRRCHYIIGNNGVGKSLLLRDIAQALHDSNLAPHEGWRKTPVLMAAFGYADRFATLPVTPDSGLRYLGDLRNQQTVTVAKREAEVAERILAIYSHAQKRSVLIALFKAFSFSAEVYFLPPDFTLKNGELESDKEIHNISFIEADNLVDFKQVRGHALAFEKQGGSMTLYALLSSGEQHILLMLLRILSALVVDCVVLVDEPELSLHVEWQQRLPAAFNMLCQRYNASFVVATHSPVLITAVPWQDKCYLATPGLLTAIEPEAMNNVEATLLDAFNIVTRNNRSVYEHCASAVSGFMQAINQGGEINSAKDEALSILTQLEIKLENQPIDTGNYSSDINLLRRARAAIEELDGRSLQERRDDQPI